MRSNISSRGFVPQIFKGVTIALLITLASVLIFAFILSAFDLTDKVIMPINQIIKTVSILVGVILSVREGKFSLKGGLIGLLSAFLSFLLFSLIAGSTTSFLTVLVDLIFASCIGLVSGLITGKVVSW